MKLLVFLMAFTVSVSAFAHTQVLSQLVYEIRDPKTDSARFRKVLKSIGEYLALQVAQDLETKEASIRTLTGADANHHLISERPVLVTILRAGLPLNAGVHKIFPDAEVGFLAMSRDETTLKAKTDYIALPNIKNRTVIVVDTMLATGGSMLDAIKIVEQGSPKKIIVVSAIASEVGIARLMAYDPTIKVFVAAIDPSLNEKGYILPGLGDAGDRSYGLKHITKAVKE